RRSHLCRSARQRRGSAHERLSRRLGRRPGSRPRARCRAANSIRGWTRTIEVGDLLDHLGYARAERVRGANASAGGRRPAAHGEGGAPVSRCRAKLLRFAIAGLTAFSSPGCHPDRSAEVETLSKYVSVSMAHHLIEDSDRALRDYVATLDANTFASAY